MSDIQAQYWLWLMHGEMLKALLTVPVLHDPHHILIIGEPAYSFVLKLGLERTLTVPISCAM